MSRLIAEVMHYGLKKNTLLGDGYLSKTILEFVNSQNNLIECIKINSGSLIELKLTRLGEEVFLKKKNYLDYNDRINYYFVGSNPKRAGVKLIWCKHNNGIKYRRRPV
jgi:hypothetical protein